MEMIKQLFRFIEESPTAFHAVQAAAEMLKSAGFCELQERDAWELTPGEGYYVTRNQSSIIAFRMPNAVPERFLITASHSDSPMFKLKGEHLAVSGEYLRLSTEVYGGTILSSWFDRPLSLAGRVIVREGDRLVSHLVNIDRDLLIIPNLAIHFNRNVNSGYSYNPALDLLPLFSLEKDVTVKSLVAKQLGLSEEHICEMELYVYNRQKPTALGASEELFAAPRIDDLFCMWGTLEGFLAVAPATSVNVFFAADNEETGSATKQGAGSVFLSDVLDRIAESRSLDRRRLLADSMMLSADNAHAKHPNHPEISDPLNAPVLGGGMVLKFNAAQKYTTEALSASLFSEICAHAGVPVQTFANRSDLAGGSTLGSISNTHVPLLSADVGVSQLAMHSACETAGCRDAEYLVRAMKAFYGAHIQNEGDGTVRLSCDNL